MQKCKFRVLSFHAEALHDERVWRRLQNVLRLFELKKRKGSFFVSPHWAIVAGKDIREKLRYLDSHGHEIGQHTHFYRQGFTGGDARRDDFSPSNVRACIKRDYEYLKNAGIVPKGFSAGAWQVPPFTRETLCDLGFVYDTSSLMYSGQPRKGLTFEHKLDEHQIFSVEGRSLLLLSTTHTLRDVAKSWIGAWNGILKKQSRYALIYLHDYDILRLKVYIPLLLLLTISPPNVTALSLAKTLIE